MKQVTAVQALFQTHGSDRLTPSFPATWSLDTVFSRHQVLLGRGARVDLYDARNRSALTYAADATGSDAADMVLEAAQRHGVATDLINAQELYLGAEQCFLVRGESGGRGSQWAWVTGHSAVGVGHSGRGSQVTVRWAWVTVGVGHSGGRGSQWACSAHQISISDCNLKFWSKNISQTRTNLADL